MSTPGEVFAQSLAAKDVERLRGVLQPELDFRGLTPGRFWEEDNAESFISDVLLGTWFEPSDEIVALQSVDTSTVGAREHVTYRLIIDNADGHHLVEQQAYYETRDDRISWLRILCSGYQRID